MPIRKPTPEESELIRRRAELEDLRTTLAGRELELIDQPEITSLRAELDEWQARIAERAAQLDPSAEASARAAAARQRARESREQAQGRSPELKKIYLEAVTAMHPAFARRPADRERRTQALAEANRAYQASDKRALRHALEDYRAGTEQLPGEPIEMELDRVAGEISLAKTRISAIDQEITDLRQSGRAASLRQQVASAREQFERLNGRNKPK
jgi:chromosome segregation ATPase